MAPPSPRLAAACVLLAALLAHGLSAGGGFVWDDTYNVRDNPEIESISNVPSFFVQAWGAGAPEGSHAKNKNRGLFRPLALSTLALDHAVYGKRPWGYHLTNLLCHALAALLVLAIARALCPGLPALLVALAWAVHPVHTEAVAVLSYRTTLLAGLVGLGALWLQVSGAPRPWVVPGRALLVGLACLAKEDALPLVIVLPLHDLFVRRAGLRRALLESLPLVLVAALYLALRQSVVQPLPFSFFEGVPLGQQILTLLAVAWLYASLLLFPFPLTPFHDWHTLGVARSPFEPAVMGGAALLALLGVVALRFRRAPVAAFLAAGLLLSLAPYSHVLPFAVAAGERFLYLPSVFALLLLARGAMALAARAGDRRGDPAPGTRLRRLGTGLALLWLIVATPWSVQRHTEWWSTRSILEATTRYYPGSFNAWKGLGDVHAEEGRPADAAAAYARAGDIAPFAVAAYLEARELARSGAPDKARARLRSYLEEHSDREPRDMEGFRLARGLLEELER